MRTYLYTPGLAYHRRREVMGQPITPSPLMGRIMCGMG